MSRSADPATPSSSDLSAAPAHNPVGVSTAASPGAVERTNDIYAEWDTMETVDAVRSAIEHRFPVVMIEANDQAYGKFRERDFDFVFNIAEGLHGVSRESQIPAMLELLQIPYLGSDPLTLGICLDKSRAKEILAYNSIPTAAFSVVRSMETLDDVRVKFPAIVKPLHEGSSKGIYNSSVVHDAEQLQQEVRTILDVYHEPALIEEFLTGREFTVALMGNGEHIEVLPIVEMKFDSLPPGAERIYSYEAKWVWDTREKPLAIFECPARVPDPLQLEIESICVAAYRVLRCRDWSRIDVRCNAKGQPQILEVNPLPGILPNPEDNSCFPKAARAAEMSYSELINRVLDIALERCGISAHKSQSFQTAQN